MDKDIPASFDTILSKLEEYSFCEKSGEKWSITNLGAILFAHNLADFPELEPREVIVHKYIGTNNRTQEYENHIKRVDPAHKFGHSESFSYISDLLCATATERICGKRG